MCVTCKNPFIGSPVRDLYTRGCSSVCVCVCVHELVLAVMFTRVCGNATCDYDDGDDDADDDDDDDEDGGRTNPLQYK